MRLMRTHSKPAADDTWHVLCETSVPVAEFGRALSKLVPVVSWVPRMSWFGLAQNWITLEHDASSPALRKVQFPLQRGYTRLPRHLGVKSSAKMVSLLERECREPSRSVLVCTSSFWARTAAAWPGPVVYYATDFTLAYTALSAKSVLVADKAMCRVADLVCPNSARLADYLHSEAGCVREKLVIVPNATRADNVRESACDAPDKLPDELPDDVRGVPRPLAGVIGNMGDNIDWELVAAAMPAAPAYHWIFVGPVPRALLSRRQTRARENVMRSPRSHFVGARLYGDLFRYARGFDVAVMPYRKIEPTYSGSSTRYYEHLAAGRPMLATRGVEELAAQGAAAYAGGQCRRPGATASRVAGEQERRTRRASLRSKPLRNLGGSCCHAAKLSAGAVRVDPVSCEPRGCRPHEQPRGFAGR